ncbi:MAG: DUF6196 family protein [Acidobacteria bacterium]|nr:DUF6196 family protein [Acidobacteriota bacterium]
MFVSLETPQQTHARLRQVMAHAELNVLDGTFAFEEVPLADFPRGANPEALAFVRDREIWSQLVPCTDPGMELFCIFCFHFAAGLDNSGFVGWLATYLKQTLGTGVLVVCGQNSRRGGIFDYWGCPAALADAVRRAIENLAAQEQ